MLVTMVDATTISILLASHQKSVNQTYGTSFIAAHMVSILLTTVALVKTRSQVIKLLLSTRIKWVDTKPIKKNGVDLSLPELLGGERVPITILLIQL